MHSMREALAAVDVRDPEVAAHLEPSEDASPALPASLAEIGDELDRLTRSVATLVAAMDDDAADPGALDLITERIVTALARIEQLRCARAWSRAKAQSDERHWVDYLDVA